MAVIVIADWKERPHNPEIIGVYEVDYEGYVARDRKIEELMEKNVDIAYDVNVYVKEIKITRCELLSKKEDEILVDALSGGKIPKKLYNKLKLILWHYQNRRMW